MKNSWIVVHGASGAQGAPVVRHLLAAGHDVRALTRHGRSVDPAAQAVPADLLDTDALAGAYRGADGVVVQLPLVFAPDLALAQAESVLRALQSAGVPRVVFNSGTRLPPAPLGVPFVDARVMMATRLAEHVPSATVVAPAITYMENLVAPWSAPKVRAGELAYPLDAEAEVPWVALDDLATTVVDLLGMDSPPGLQVVTGPQALTGEQAAAELSAVLGHQVRWRTIDPAEYERMLAPHLGTEAAAGIAAAYAPPAPGAPPTPEPDPAVLRTGVVTLKEWASRQDWDRA
ncbi:SDR family oxidoreductase [Actinomadura rudentiformis]|uniref:NAD(P)H-binding protein n=1 Tax=Actinomadura rudentiformis TaxID=359158 RepID=A0A6H9YMZ4_9ACTN|nr:NmrA family NAD(P)-binding protein [Actinomadura rudentiformis]KAB2342697.1 NAD(P)H-binding protein [Actinomadura rudentiformis]